MHTTDDYTKLPNGTVMIARDGRRYVKGPHPIADWVVPSIESPLAVWAEDHKDNKAPDWSGLRADGTCRYDGESFRKYDMIGYELAQPFDVDAEIDAVLSVGKQAAREFAEEMRAQPWPATIAQDKPAVKRASAKPAISGLGTIAHTTHLFGGWGTR